VEVEDRFVGWISFIYLPKVGKYRGHGHVYVDELWIEPSYRRNGLAKALLVKADELAQKLSAKGIRLYVNTENPGAQRLYQEHGFEMTGTAYFCEK